MLTSAAIVRASMVVNLPKAATAGAACGIDRQSGVHEGMASFLLNGKESNLDEWLAT